MTNYEEQSKHFEKLKAIKLFLTDVDGILTDGSIQWQGSEVGWNRTFHVRDGYGLKMIQSLGVKVGLISGGDSKGLRERMGLLHAERFSSLGNEDKREGYLRVVKDAQVEDHQVLYLGDEYFDIPLLKKVGFAATVKTASPAIKEVCDYVCEVDAGKGCVREVIDMLCLAQNLSPEIPDFN